MVIRIIFGLFGLVGVAGAVYSASLMLAPLKYRWPGWREDAGGVALQVLGWVMLSSLCFYIAAWT